MDTAQIDNTYLARERRRASLQRQRGQGGSGVVGAAIAIGIGIIALGTVLLLADGAFSSQKTSAVIAQFNAIQNAANGEFSNSPTGFQNITAAAVANSGSLPASQVVGTPPNATGLQDPYHGSIYIDPVQTSGAPVDNGYTVSDDAIPQSVCVALLTKDYGSGVQDLSAQASTGSDPGALTPPTTPVERLPLATAKTDCAGATDVVSFTVVP